MLSVRSVITWKLAVFLNLAHVVSVLFSFICVRHQPHSKKRKWCETAYNRETPCEVLCGRIFSSAQIINILFFISPYGGINDIQTPNEICKLDGLIWIMTRWQKCPNKSSTVKIQRDCIHQKETWGKHSTSVQHAVRWSLMLCQTSLLISVYLDIVLTLFCWTQAVSFDYKQWVLIVMTWPLSSDLTPDCKNLCGCMWR